ncbi:MAG TPA: Lrp/AsnC family transcriptional regulator [Thermoanaerobaculia bacterium]|nr:Lrp/AsnC family transcriptional regulator [Thermoanaerobaculia bacterium]
MQANDQRDRDLLGALQGEIPLVSTPFAVIGQMIDMSEKEVIKRTEKLKREGLVKQVAATFDVRGLGYKSSLVAARVNPERVDEAAAVISAHPGVTQNYRRNNELNLWFTVAVSPSSRLGLDRTIALLGEQAECEAVRPLPTIRQFKGSAEADWHGSEESQSDHAPLTAAEIEAVRLLQRDFPLQPRPFDVLARASGIGADELLAATRNLFARGQLRRFSAAIQPRKPGFVATAMGVWVVPADRTEEYASRLAEHRAVSHCYLRPVYDDWPYNVYTTVHGRSVDECESIINELATDTGLQEKQALYPTKEYKRARLNLFAPDADEWEAGHASARAVAVS